MAHAANDVIPHYLEPQLLYPFGCESAFVGDDFILVAEFAEIEGPRPIKLICSGLPSGVDVNHLAMKVLPVDHHFYHPRDSFVVAKDMQLLMSDSQFDLTLLVHSFKLYDIAARGYVRPMCVTYGSRDHNKMSLLYEELSKLLYEAVGLMEQSNRMVFLNDLERHYASLLRLHHLCRRQCHMPDACPSANAEAKEGTSPEADDSRLLREQQMQEKEQQPLKHKQDDTDELPQQQQKARQKQSEAIESALSEIGVVISGLGGKPDREAELALPTWDTEQPATGFSDPEITAMSAMLLHKPTQSDLYDVDELCPKVGEVWKLLESVHEYYQRMTCEILCHKTDFLISAPASGLLVRSTGEPLVNCLLSLNGEQRDLSSDVRDTALEDDVSLNDRFYSVGSDTAVWWAASLATAVGSETHSASGSESKVVRAAAAASESKIAAAGPAFVDVVSCFSCSSTDLDRSILSSTGELLKNSPQVSGSAVDGLDHCVSDTRRSPFYIDDRQMELLPIDDAGLPVLEHRQATVDLAEEGDSLSARESCRCQESCGDGSSSRCCGSQSEGRCTLREATPMESLLASATPQRSALKEDAGSSAWSDDVDGSLDSGGERGLGWSQSPSGWSSSSSSAVAPPLPLSCRQLTVRPHLTIEAPADMQAFLRKPEGAARLTSVHAGVLLRLAVELPFFPVLVYSLLIGRPVVIVAEVDSLPRTDESCGSTGYATPPANPGRPLDQQLLDVVRALETLVPCGGADRSQSSAASASDGAVDDCISKCVYQSHVASSNGQRDKMAKHSAAARQARTFGLKQARQRTSTISYPVSLLDACQHKIIGVFREKSAGGAAPNSSGDTEFAVAAQNVLNHVTILNLSTKCLRGPTYTGSFHADLRRFRKEKELHRAEALRLYFDRVISAFAMKAFVLHHSTCHFWDTEPSEQGARSQYAAKRKGILRGLHLHADDAEIVQVRPTALLGGILWSAAATGVLTACFICLLELAHEAMSLQYMANLVDRQQAECYMRRAWKIRSRPAGSAGRLTVPWMNVSNKPCKVYGRRNLLTTYLFGR